MSSVATCGRLSRKWWKKAYERRFRGENPDPYASRVYERDGAPAGLVLIARRRLAPSVSANAPGP